MQEFFENIFKKIKLIVRRTTVHAVDDVLSRLLSQMQFEIQAR